MPKVKAPAKGEELLAQLETRLRETYGEGDPDDIPVGWEKHPLAGVTYFQRDEGCLNEGSVIGDVEELERGIIKLFYTYFDPIRTAVEKELNIKMPEWAKIVVEPDYEDTTFVVVFLTEAMVVLHHQSIKAWYFRWNTPEEMAADMAEVYEEMLKRAKAALKGV